MCCSFNIFCGIFICVWTLKQIVCVTFTFVFDAVTWASLVFRDFQFMWLGMSHKNAYHCSSYTRGQSSGISN